MTKQKTLEKLDSSRTNKRLDLRGDLWLTEFKKLAVSLSAPFSLGGFAPQALHQKKDYLETAAFLTVNEFSIDQGCDLFNAVRSKLSMPKDWIFGPSAPRSPDDLPRKNQTRSAPNKTCFLTQLGKNTIENLEVEWDHSIEGLLRFLKKGGKLSQSIRIAFDYHLIPFYGEPGSEFIHKSRVKNGTNYFFKYITCSICVAGYRIKVGVKMLKKKEHSLEWMRSWLERLLMQGIKIEWVLLDRGFYSVLTCLMIDGLGLKFLMPAKKTNPIKELAWQYYNKESGADQGYTLRSGHEKFTGSVIFATKRGNLNAFRRQCQGAALSRPQVLKKIWVYFTNWKPPTEPQAHLRMIREIPGIYKSRWGIETAYRMIGKFHVPTCSRAPSVRFFLFLFQAFMYNCWVVTNLILILRFNVRKDRPVLTQTVFRFEIDLFWIQSGAPAQEPPPPAKKPSLLARFKNIFRRDRT